MGGGGGVGGAGGAHRALMSFHHILSSKKIGLLHAWAQELELQGILKTGYPGVVLVTDRAPSERLNVAEYVRRIKRLPWQTCELRLLEPVGCMGALWGLRDVLHSPGQASRLSRRSGLVEFDTLKTIYPLLREADAHDAARHASSCRAPCASAWAPFYRRAMRA